MISRYLPCYPVFLSKISSLISLFFNVFVLTSHCFLMFLSYSPKISSCHLIVSLMFPPC